MPARSAALDDTAHGELVGALAALRERSEVPTQFSPKVLAEADAASAAPADSDLSDIPFVTLDPASSRDLDQAFHLERRVRGWRVRYAIADVPGFVRPGGAIDQEARRRGQTLYLPGGTVPLHPRVLSEGAVSLLPDQDRTAYVWTIDLDSSGADVHTRLERALIRSRAKLDYAGLQAQVDAGTVPDDSPAALLAEVGRARIEQERLRGGASLNLPEEEVEQDASGRFRLVQRASRAVEEWNAQLSLLTGMAAAKIMLDAGIGVLRTMPAPDDQAEAEFRACTVAVGMPWAGELTYGEFLRNLPRGEPATLAVLQAATVLFRGAGYTVFDGSRPEQITQAALAAPYAHVTAPLRRLVDRWGLVLCEAAVAGREPPAWVRESLPEVPRLMQTSSSRASQLNAQAIGIVEAAVLADRVGERFTVVVLAVDENRARIRLSDPPVTTWCELSSESGSKISAGEELTVTLIGADIGNGVVDFHG